MAWRPAAMRQALSSSRCAADWYVARRRRSAGRNQALAAGNRASGGGEAEAGGEETY